MTELTRSWSDEPASRCLPLTTERKTVIMTNRKARALTVGVASGAALLMATGVGYAFWTTTGSGSGSATARGSSALTVSATASVTGLYPTASGIAGGSINVTNPNPFKVNIGSVFATPTTGAVGCTPSVVTFTVAAGAPTSINAGATVAIPFTASMSNAAEDLCQGATFTSTLQVSGQSAV